MSDSLTKQPIDAVQVKTLETKGNTVTFLCYVISKSKPDAEKVLVYEIDENAWLERLRPLVGGAGKIYRNDDRVFPVDAKENRAANPREAIGFGTLIEYVCS